MWGAAYAKTSDIRGNALSKMNADHGQDQFFDQAILDAYS